MRSIFAFLVLLPIFASESIAEVTWDATLKGSAGVGIVFKDLRQDNAAFTIDTFDNEGLTTELDVQFAIVGRSSSELSFGLLAEGYNLTSRFRDEDFQIQAFLSGSFGTLVFGEAEGAYDRVLRENDKGQTLLDAPSVAWLEHGSNSGLDHEGTNVLRYDFVNGGFTFSTSIARRTDPDEFLTSRFTSTDLGVGLSWKGLVGNTSVEVGLAKQVNDRDISTSIPDPRAVREATGISVAIGQDDFGITLTHSRFERDFRPQEAVVGSGSTKFTGLSGWKQFGALTLGALVSEQTQHDFSSGAYSGKGYGVWVEYDLNESAKLSLGYGRSDFTDSPWYVEDRRATVGLIYNF